jgi:dihydroxy-acid dehydratase
MKKNKSVLIDKNPGRNAQTFGIARELRTNLDYIHNPSVGVIGNGGDSQCYLGVKLKVDTIHEALKNRIDKKIVTSKCGLLLQSSQLQHQTE